MLRILVLLIIVGFLTAGCALTGVRTVKWERVDQKVKGNRGYIMGEVPPYTGEKKPPRELMVIDIEVDSPDWFEEEEEGEEAKEEARGTASRRAVPIK